MTRLADAPSNGSTSASPDLRTLEVAITGMTCGACAARIQLRLNRLEGVSAVVNLATERASVTTPTALPPEAVLAEIEALGYGADEVDEARSFEAERRSDEERVRSIRRRLFVALILVMPLCDVSLAFSLVPQWRFPGWQWFVVLLAAPMVIWVAWPIHANALRAARHRVATMDTLVSLGIISSTAWSLFVLFFRDRYEPGQDWVSVLVHQSNGAIYIDVAAAVTTFLLLGRYIEAAARRTTGSALRSLASLSAKEASVIADDGSETRLPASRLQPGTRFVVRPGERVAADGLVIRGRADLDRSLLTGESEPIGVSTGDSVIGGTIVLNGRLVVEATAVGSGTQLAQIIRLVENAQQQRAAVQRVADRVSAVFVPVVLLLAALTFTGWMLSTGSPSRAFGTSLAVVIIACPCALGLATPTAMYVASSRGAQLGIFVKSYEALETARAVDTVVFDKTGTVTEGRLTVTSVHVAQGEDEAAVLRAAAAVENASEHVIASAIVQAAHAGSGEPLPEVSEFRSLAGMGAGGVVEGRSVTVGSARMLAWAGSSAAPDSMRRWCDEEDRAARTTVLVSIEGRVVAAIAVSDAIKPSAQPAVRELQKAGLRCILLSGDAESTSRAVGSELGVDDVVAEALPADKLEVIRSLQRDGRSVAVVGDGVNDAPALALADLGIAIGSGTDVAINAADLILLRDDLSVVPSALRLARTTLRTIHVNLAWAFAYNVAAIPLAAVGILNPLIAGASMALSSTFVVLNSSRIRRLDRDKVAAPSGPSIDFDEVSSWSGDRSDSAPPTNVRPRDFVSESLA